MPAASLRTMPARSISLWLAISASLGASRVVARWNRDRRMEAFRVVERGIVAECPLFPLEENRLLAVLLLLRARGRQFLPALHVTHVLLRSAGIAGSERLVAVEHADVAGEIFAQLGAIGGRIGNLGGRGRCRLRCGLRRFRGGSGGRGARRRCRRGGYRCRGIAVYLHPLVLDTSR